MRKVTMVVLAVITSLSMLLAAGCGSRATENSTVNHAAIGGQTESGGQSQVSESAGKGTDSTVPGTNEHSDESKNTSGSAKDSPSDPSASDAAIQMGKITAVRLIDPSSGWVGGDGWIARTEDSGKSWQVQYQGEETVDQLFALNGQDAWAVFATDSGQTEDRRLLQTHDGGKHWMPVGRVPNGGFLHFTSKQDVFAANAFSSDGGKTWSNLPIPKHIKGDAYFHDKDHGWAALQEGKKLVIQRTVDGGKTWETVMSRDTVVDLRMAVIRSAGTNDAWVECIGDSGMSQTGFSLFHTSDGGKNWLPVLNNTTAGAGPGPGFPMNDAEDNVPSLSAGPGTLYVVNTEIAYMSGFCAACDGFNNNIGWTTDGGTSWTNSEAAYPGFAGSLLAVADSAHGWWICTDNAEPSVMYTTADGGKTWTKAHIFDRPQA